MPPRACGPGARSTRSRRRASRRCSINGSGTRCSAAPLSIISSVYKIVHFDAPHVQRAMGARPKPPLPVTEPRWAQQAHAAESWTGGDVECDVVVDWHRGGWGGGRSRARRARPRGGLRRGGAALPSPQLRRQHGAGLRALLPAGVRPRERHLPHLRRADGGWLDGDQRRDGLPAPRTACWTAGARRWTPTPCPLRGWRRTSSGWRPTSAWLRRRAGTWGPSPR